MANTKGKIIIASGLVLVAGVTTAIVFSHLRKKRVIKQIYDKINDTTSEQGQQAVLNEENQLLGSNAFDPNFWKKTSGTKPNPNLLMPSKNAREIATKIYNLSGVTDDEKGIINEFKKLKSKGQVSQVASAYQNTPQGGAKNDYENAIKLNPDESGFHFRKGRLYEIISFFIIQ